MYWPVGTPRIFATSSSHTPTFNLVVSHDGLPSPPPLRDDKPDHQSSLLPADPTSSQDALGLPGALSPATPTTPLTPATPGIKSVEQGYHDESREHESSAPVPVNIPRKEPMLALRVARSGHLFATITATSMTIWQMKVRLFSLPWRRRIIPY